MRLNSLLLTLALLSQIPRPALGACGGTTITYSSTTSNDWDTAANWDVTNVPDVPTEDAVIVSTGQNPRINSSKSIGCLEVQSGTLRTNGNYTLTINGDYFRNLTPGGFTCRSADGTFLIDFAGSADQTFENEDTVNNIQISNDNTVTFTNPFALRTNLTFNTSSGTLKIKANLTLNATGTVFTIPAGVTVEVSDGAILEARGGITVNGTLIVKPGSQIIVYNNKTLTVNSGGLLKLEGASESVATLTSDGATRSYTFNMDGNFVGNYFRIEHTKTNGLNVGATGVVQQLDNGEFHYIANNGRALTLAAGSSIPTTVSNLGFYNDGGVATAYNINANAFTGTAFTVEDWAGSVGGAANEQDSGSKVTWGSQASTKLNLVNATASGTPNGNTAQSVADKLFNTFAFSLNGVDTATDITSITFSMIDTGASSDILNGKVFLDDAAGTACTYDAGVDTQVGGDLVFRGNPPQATVTLDPGDIQTDSDSNIQCIHLTISTSGVALAARRLRFAISSSTDVVNSEGYSFNGLAGPPVNGRPSTLNGDTMRQWTGDTTQLMGTGANWSGGTAPTSGTDCRIGVGTRVAQMNGSVNCQNALLITGGEIDWNSTANTFTVYSLLDVDASYTFTNATSGKFILGGSSLQSVRIRTPFPGDVDVNNDGAGGVDYVDIDDNSEIEGDLTIVEGVLRISPGYTLTVGGDITVEAGGTLEVAPGATLVLSDNATLTVDSGGTLSLVGTASSPAAVTSTSTSDGYSVVVNGTIAARYYSFSRLGAGGVSIENGATLDGTNFLQDGAYSYPVDNSTTLLRLKRQITGDTLTNMAFSTGGSSASSPISIDTTGAAAGTLTISNYSGNLSGTGNDNPDVYDLLWSGATNTIQISRDLSGPGSVDAGSTYNMGRFAFQQEEAGVSFNDADITSLKLTLTGTATAAAVSQARLYYDSDCNSSGGTLIGTGTFSGSPGTTTFSPAADAATLPADDTATEERCLYVEFDIAAAATNGATIGVKIQANGDFANDQSYGVSSSTPLPVTLGTAATIVGATSTSWLGTSSTDWFTPGNWSAGVPGAAVDCTIPSAGNNPSINGASGTAACKSMNITNGTLTLANGTGAILHIYGNFTNTGTLTQNDGTFAFVDNAVTPTDQTLNFSGTLTSLTFDKRAGGTVALGASLTINALTFPNPGSTFTFRVPNSRTLTLPNGLVVDNGTFKVEGGGIVKLNDGEEILVSGGTFQIAGTNDSYPQNLASKGKITVNGSGTWSFRMTSGTTSLTGFQLDYVGTSGVQFNGGTLSTLDGGQLTNLPTDYANVNAVRFNLSALPATSTNFGWHWWPNHTAPESTDSYIVASSTGCGGGTLTFNQWFGDFYDGTNPDPQTKVSASGCTLTIGTAASAVSLSSLAATGFNGAISLDWETAWEASHQGFHVYRSTNPLYGYVRVSPELVRNINDPGSARGLYRFVDTDVTADVVYYYQIEDVALNGDTSRHGPVSAVFDDLSADLPESEEGTNEQNGVAGGGESVAPPDTEVTNGGLVDLGNGAHLVAKQRDWFRLRVQVPEPEFAPSAWNGAYESVSGTGYSPILVSGHPETLERVILVEVKPEYSSAAEDQILVSDSDLGIHTLQPAPTWQPNGEGTLVPSYAPDGAAYATNALLPAPWAVVDPALVTVGGRKYARITVYPVRHNAATGETRGATALTVDVSLAGGPAPAPPSADLAQSPSAVEGSLRIRYRQAGLYGLEFDALAEAGVERGFDGVATEDLRLYWQSQEIPLEVESADGTFGAGDRLQFYAPSFASLDDPFSEVVLASQPLGDSSGPALRMEAVDADPTESAASTKDYSFEVRRFEQDTFAVMDRPLGTGVDRFYWKQISREAGQAAHPTASFLTVDADLPGLLPSGNSVRVRLELRGYTVKSNNATLRFGLWVNASDGPVAVAEVAGGDPRVVTLFIEDYWLHEDLNQFRVEALADNLEAPDSAILQVNWLEVGIRQRLAASGDRFQLRGPLLDQAVTVDGFTLGADVRVYDMTEPLRPTRLTGVISEDGESFSQVTFTPSEGPSGQGGSEFVLATDAGLRTPEALILVEGFDPPLKSTSRSADLLVLGSPLLLNQAEDYLEYRRAQGLRVAVASPDQVYAEFSHGQKSAQGIRAWIQYALQHWQSPAPRYLLILGRASYDPRGVMGGPDLLPLPLERGTFLDFGTDHWFVEDPATGRPLLAVGRIPTEDPALLQGYFNKLMAYERGDRAPLVSSPRATFVSDRDFVNEAFALKASQLAAAWRQQNSQMETPLIDRGALGSETATLAAIREEFNRGPLAITYVGHGDVDIWGTGALEEDEWVNLFSSPAALSLTNTRLPLVVGLNCLNANFYDPELESIGGSLILAPQGGAPAFFGFTTLTVPTAQMQLQNALQAELEAELRNAPREVRLGDLQVRVKGAVAMDGHARDSVRSFTLLGDPSLRLPNALFRGVPDTPGEGGTTVEGDGLAEPSPPLARAESGEGGGGCGRAHGRRPLPQGTGAGALAWLVLLLLAGRIRFIDKSR